MSRRGINRCRLRVDTAGYEHKLLRYCGEGRNKRFGRIDIGVDVTPAFKSAAAEAAEGDWKPIRKKIREEWVNTGQEWAEVIHWQRGRCGKGEEAHSVMKEDLAGGKMPSGSP